MAWWVWACWVGAGVLGVGALGVLYVALLRDRSRGRRRCPRCWYDMAGVPGLRCPECGREAGRERSFFRTRRRWGLAAAGVGLGLVAYAGWVTPGVVKTGKWWTAVPRPVLAVVVQFWDDEEMSLLQHLMDANSRYRIRSWGPTWEQGPEHRIEMTAVERWLLAKRCAAILDDPDESGPSLATSNSYPPSPPFDSWVRRGIALRVLAGLQGSAAPAGDSVIRRLGQFGDRWMYTEALASVAASSPSFAVTVGGFTRDPSASKRLVALRALRIAGPSASAAVPYLVDALRTLDDSDSLSAAAAAVVRVLPAGQALDELSRLTRSPKRNARVIAVQNIGQLKGVADRAIPFLAATARDKSLRISRECILAMAEFGPGCITSLIELADDQDMDLAELALSTLWTFRSDAAPAVPTLIRLLAKPDFNLRHHALSALGMIGPDAEAARPAIEAMLTDPDPRLREAAADALKMMGERK